MLCAFPAWRHAVVGVEFPSFVAGVLKCTTTGLTATHMPSAHTIDKMVIDSLVDGNTEVDFD